MQRILERSDKSPFDKGGFRGNVDALITRKGELFDSPFLCDSGGIDAAASLYCVFPLESSAELNKKAVLSTAVFVISATFCEQVPTVADTTKATLPSGFLVGFALVIPAGFEPTTHSLEGCCSIQLSYGTRPVFRVRAL